MLNQFIYKDIRDNNQGSDGDVPPEPPDLPGYYYDEGGEVDEEMVSDELLRAKNGRLIYSDGCSVMLYTWWDFGQDGENESPYAYINGDVRCWGHWTGHIIDYEIKRNKIYGGKGSITIYVHMSMGHSGSEGNHWNGGAPCIHRLWSGSGGTSGFYDADPDHRCEKSGTCGGGATFKVVFDTNAGTFRIS